MQITGDKQDLPSGKNGSTRSDAALDAFVALFPMLYSSVNRVLEEGTPGFSKRVGVALWAISSSKFEDNTGKYLTPRQLNVEFRQWFAQSEKTVASQVSKTKADLLDLDFAIIQGGSGRLHLTEKGKLAAHQMMSRVKEALQSALGGFSEAEQKTLFDLCRRMVEGGLKRPSASESGHLF